jgi:hypothetical protein
MAILPSGSVMYECRECNHDVCAECRRAFIRSLVQGMR